MKVLLALWALIVAVNAATTLRIPTFIDSNMVLQRAPQSAHIWGWAKWLVKVTVHIAGQSHKVTSDIAGKWEVKLNPVAAGGPYDLMIESSDGGNINKTNILFGDVWFCSGQSNMEMVVGDVFDADKEIADSINYPNLRLYSPAKVVAKKVEEDAKSRASYVWAPSSPDAVHGADWDYFSATCYFAGRDMHKKLGIPIGLVASSWGGTYIQAWSSPNALSKCGSLDGWHPVPFSSSIRMSPPLSPNDDPNQPSVLWNGMVAPFRKMALAGFLWYQGESNSGDAKKYECQFPAMIEDWRSEFGNKDAGFYFVQLAAYTPGVEGSFMDLRWAQTAALKLNMTGMATAIDLGDPQSPLDPIHPRSKPAVGARLAATALGVQFDQPEPYLGPQPLRIQLSQHGAEWTYRITYTYASGGLTPKGTAFCTSCCTGTPLLYEIQQADGKWVPAKALIQGDIVTVTATVDAAMGVRYAWLDYPECVLYNADNLPAPPFTHKG